MPSRRPAGADNQHLRYTVNNKAAPGSCASANSGWLDDNADDQDAAVEFIAPANLLANGHS
jgi:hypothetical protein